MRMDTFEPICKFADWYIILVVIQKLQKNDLINGLLLY